MIDHKAALRALAAEDGCKASLLAAAHIEYIERQLVSSSARGTTRRTSGASWSAFGTSATNCAGN